MKIQKKKIGGGGVGLGGHGGWEGRSEAFVKIQTKCVFLGGGISDLGGGGRGSDQGLGWGRWG